VGHPLLVRWHPVHHHLDDHRANQFGDQLVLVAAPVITGSRRYPGTSGDRGHAAEAGPAGKI
jgi:hypothetical protein